MYRIKGSIKLVADVLFNKPTQAALDSLDGGQRGKKLTVEQKLAEVPQKLHMNGKGAVLLSDMFKESLVEGSKFAGLKIGKRSLYPILKAVVFVESDLPFGVGKCDYIHEHQGRVPPRTGALTIIRRPAFKAGRTLPFSLLVAEDIVEPDQIKIAVQHGGTFIGVGSWRPRFGRYQLVDWKVEKTA